MFLALLILLHVAIVNGFRSPSQIIVFNAAQVRANSQPLNRNSHVRVADSSLSARGLPLWASNTAAEVEEQERADAILIRRIEEEVMAESGVALDQLINPSKVVNLERDLMQLRMRRDSGELSSAELRVVDETIKKKEKILFMEKRAVMRGWLAYS